jgi:excisionase family DNA binding protein
MSTLLTSQEMQDLINVDRSTVYRMADDGRLPGVKVGRQWRFPADRVAAQLGLAAADTEPTLPLDRLDDAGLAGLLRPDDAQSIADLVAELFGVMAVITDMDGHPITAVANPCGYYGAISDQPDAVAACLSRWRLFADESNVAPRWVRTHLGFLCARTFVWVDLKPVGMIVVGGVTPTTWPPDRRLVESIADEVGVPLHELLDHVDETWDLDVAAQRRVLQLLPQLGDLVSQLVTANRRLAGCLDRETTRSHHPTARVPQGGDRS